MSNYQRREMMREVRLWITGVVLPIVAIAAINNPDGPRKYFDKAAKAVTDFKTKHNF